MKQFVLQIIPYAGLLAGLLFCVLVEQKRRQRETEQRWNKRQMLLQSELGKLRGIMVDLQTRLQEAEMRSERDMGAHGPLSGLNVNRRTQAIRLLRRGERPEQVAATLGVPPPEAELLLKVHRITMGKVADS